MAGRNRIAASEIFFIVPARTAEGIEAKRRELEHLGAPYVIICGENIDAPDVVYRPRRGKYDAINYGRKFITQGTRLVCLNDVDTRIVNFENAVRAFADDRIALLFCKLRVTAGPQVQFYAIMDRVRRTLQIASSGELMLIRRDVFDKVLPIPPCKTEDNYISFKVLELGFTSLFCESCWTETERTVTFKDEEAYKTRTVTGIYQALSMTQTSPLIRLFYLLLPFASPLLLLHGRRGLAWMRGIIRGYTGYLLGDREGKF